jgi:hypothetical protein
MAYDARILVQPDVGERAADRHEKLRARREIEDARAVESCKRVAQHDEILRASEVESDVLEAIEKTAPYGVVDTVFRRYVRFNVALDPGAVFALLQRFPRDRNDLARRMEHARAMRLEERGKDLAHRKIAGAAEEYEDEIRVALHESERGFENWM